MKALFQWLAEHGETISLGDHHKYYLKRSLANQFSP